MLYHIYSRNMILQIVLFLQFFCAFNDAQNFDFEDYVQMVNETLNNASVSNIPTDNSRLMEVIDDETYDYGTFDFIVVGAGAAGAVIANRLSEIKCWKVLLLEAGGEQTAFSDIPALEYALIFSDMNWGYVSTPQAPNACLGMINSSCESPRGLLLGGSTVLNSKMMVRGNREDFNNWASLGNEGWSFEEVLPYFIKSEHSHIPNADPGYHGTKGPIDVSYFEELFTTKMFIDGMQELDYEVVDYNGEQQIGVSRIQSSLKKNLAVSSNRAYIDPVRKRKNLNVTTNALVTKVLINNRTAQGVEFIKNGHTYFASARKEVILSAGAINSPQLLMLSGIGPKDHLRSLGIESSIDLPVGSNLLDHFVLFGFCVRTNQSLFNESLSDLLKLYLDDHRPYTAGSMLDSTAFINVDDPESVVPNIQYVTLVAPGLALNNQVARMNQTTKEEYQKQYNGYTDFLVLVTLIRPKSTGTLTLQSNSMKDFPILDYNYLSHPEDIETAYKGILQAIRLLDTDAFKAFNASLVNLAGYCGELDESREYWYCVCRHLMTTMFHTAGTTAMGISTENSVVDPELLVHGMENLRVADAGVMPNITSGNIQAPVYMIGEKVSDLIKQRYLKKKQITG